MIRTCLYFFQFQSNKAICNAKKFRKSNRQYLKNQQTVLSSPDSPCQTVLKLPEIHARHIDFYSPLVVDKVNLMLQLLYLKSCQQVASAVKGVSKLSRACWSSKNYWKLVLAIRAVDSMWELSKLLTAGNNCKSCLQLVIAVKAEDSL